METYLDQGTDNFSLGQYQQPQNDSSSLKMRLDTEQMLLEVETFLRTITNASGQKITEYGINSIMSQLRLRFNTQIVQGNFYVDKHGYSEQYSKYIYTMRISLTEYLISKRIDFGIDDADTMGIIDAIMDCLEPFSTRLLGNGERNSYNNTLQSKDTIIHSPSKGISKLFKQ